MKESAVCDMTESTVLNRGAYSVIRGKMSVTLREIVASGVMGRSEVVAGSAYLDRPVEYIDVLESPSGYKWLQPNVIVLSTIYPLMNDEQEQRLLFPHLHEAGASAIAIKPQRFIEKIPDFMMADSETYHIPIIKLPPEISFGELISGISSLLTDENAETLLKTIENIQESFDIVQNGGGRRGILEHLAKATGCAVIAWDADLCTVTCSYPPAMGEKDFPDILVQSCCLKEKLIASGDTMFRRSLSFYNPPGIYSYAIAPILYRGSTLGYLTVVEKTGSLTSIPRAIMRTIVTNSANTIAMLLSVQAAWNTESQRLRDAVICGILSGETSREVPWSNVLKTLKIPSDAAYIVAVAKAVLPNGKEEQAERVCHLLRSFAGPAAFETVVTIFQGNIILLFPQQGRDLATHDALASYCEVICRNLKIVGNLSLYMFFGKPCESIDTLFKSYRQALDTLRFYEGTLPDSPSAFFEDIEVYNLLSCIDNPSTAQAYIHKYLGSLTSAADLRFDPMETLDMYLQCGGSVSQTAKRMRVHENTIKYRILKLRPYLPGDLDDPEFFFRIRLALLLVKSGIS